MVPAAGERKEGGEKEAHVRSGVRPDQFKASLIALTSLAFRDREGESPGQMESKDVIVISVSIWA